MSLALDTLLLISRSSTLSILFATRLMEHYKKKLTSPYERKHVVIEGQ